MQALDWQCSLPRLRAARRPGDARVLVGTGPQLEWEAGVRSFRLKVSLQTQNPTYSMFVLDDTERGVLAGTSGASTYAGTALAIANSRS